MYQNFDTFPFFRLKVYGQIEKSKSLDILDFLGDFGLFHLKVYGQTSWTEKSFFSDNIRSDDPDARE